MYTNADSLLNKLDELKSRFMGEESPDIIMITEVVPKNLRYTLNKAEIDLNGYEMFPSGFPTDARRGVVIYAKRELNAVELDIKSNFKESVWVKIPLVNHDRLLCGCIYKSPSLEENNIKELNS